MAAEYLDHFLQSAADLNIPTSTQHRLQVLLHGIQGIDEDVDMAEYVDSGVASKAVSEIGMSEVVTSGAVTPMRVEQDSGENTSDDDD